MKFAKKLLITIILITFGILLWKLMIERQKIKRQFSKEGFREGAWFGSSSQTDELNKLKITYVPAAIINVADTSAALPLKQLCIKASYNSALTGNYINVEMLKYLLYRGCRFMDFEVFSFDDNPYVAYSTDSTYSSINTQNKETLQDVLTCIANYAFTTPTPNTADPMFIHLRIKTNNDKLYDKIGSVIDYVLKTRMYLDSNSGNATQVTGDTILNDIRGKVIIVLDKGSAPTYKTVSGLGSYVNMESNSEVLRTYSYSVLTQQLHTVVNIKDDGLNTDVVGMKLVMPDLVPNLFGSTRNSIYKPMVLDYGAQVVMYPFYQVDMYLGQYESAFAAGKSAFVPLSKMITNLKDGTNNN
jgi:hypothetical protein